ncbi:hypothetical protein [uncultured Lentibacter sp.]|jgi:hypothetical protein|uniref:hypothetical protein n=1 Tax=uncultured Lentibacter sp. TaxID=1659309 RepID=UPI002618CAA7|nr:hypothetical protein [uncultured Lentibacter sp.]
MNKLLPFLALTTLVSCGSNGYKSAPRYTAAIPAATSGPISRACLVSDRKARSRQLCGCIQAVADMTLSKPDQSLAASFYGNPQKAQDIRQSSAAGHERFWAKYSEYADTAEQICG